DDSNEITAVPLLLQLLELKGCIVTLDALHCQKATAEEILKREADYVLALKGNQEGLRSEVEAFFEAVVNERTFGYEIGQCETVDGEHGRIETRRYWQVSAPEYMKEKAAWPGLVSVGMVESKREMKGKVSEERRYYVSSLSVDVKRFSEAVRGHWSVENSLRWILDVVFREDDSRVRVGH